MSLPYEGTINVVLSKILESNLGSAGIVRPESQGEKEGIKRRFDIEIEYKGVDFIIEASYDKNDAESDAKKRLNAGMINTLAIALHYDPEKFRNKNTNKEILEILENSNLNLKIFMPGQDISQTLLSYIYNTKRLPATQVSDWISIKISDFRTFLDSILEFLVNEDIFESLINKIENETEEFIEEMNYFLKRNPNTPVLKELNILLFAPASSNSIASREEQHVPNEVIFANAYLSLLVGALLYESITNAYNLLSLKQYLFKYNNDPYVAFGKAFDHVLKNIDYEKILKLALEIITTLNNVKTQKKITEILANIPDIVSQILSNKMMLRQDFVGRLYHKITGDVSARKGYATFYTKPAIALLLANLTFHSKPDFDVDWGDLSKIKDFKVSDFACGSGTLLSAVYNVMFSNYIKKSQSADKPIDVERFHKTVIENCIYGFDALEHAVQMASAVLALHVPGVALDTMNLYAVPLGEGSLGSLNLLSAFSWDMEKIGLNEFVKDTAQWTKFDLVIMNPPFSRSTAPGKAGSKPSIFGFITDEKEFEKMWNRYKELIDKEIVGNGSKFKKNNEINKMIEDILEQGLLNKQAINPLNAGAALPFIFLADRYVKDNGKIALVLPKSVLSNSSFLYARALILKKYNIDYIIYSSEEGNYNFSYSTNLSEILLILSKKRNDQQESVTKIINLKRQPKNALDALMLVDEILKINEDSASVSSVYSIAEIKSVQRDMIESNVLNWAIFTAPDNLIDLVLNIQKGYIFNKKVSLIKLKDLNAFIKDSRIFRGEDFDKNFYYDSKGYKLLSEAGKKVYNSLEIKPNSDFIKYINPKTDDGKEIINNALSNVFIPGTVRFNTIPLLAVFSEDKMVSSGSFMLDLKSPIKNKALVVWLNSALMINYIRLSFLSEEGNFGHISGYLIDNLPFFDDEIIIKKLSMIFDKYKNISWLPLPEQLEDAIKNRGIRYQFDKEILEAIIETVPKQIDDRLKEIYMNLHSLISS